MTTEGSNAIFAAAKKRGDARILSLGEDLIAKEVRYHHSCRRMYLRDNFENVNENSNRKKHDQAFANLSQFITRDVVEKKIPVMGSILLKLYSQEYLAAGGTEEEIQKYTLQSLLSKIKTRLSDIRIEKMSSKSGNCVFPSSMTLEEALMAIKHSDTRKEEIRNAALVLRAEILATPQSKIPSPTSIHLLKETSPNISYLLTLFYRTLLCGLQSEGDLPAQVDATERKIYAMASDAVYNCLSGSTRPWKHLALGLGLCTLTGSKKVITILNRFGHCISYDEVKRLETEIAFTCSSAERNTPAGLLVDPSLATGASIISSLGFSCVFTLNKSGSKPVVAFILTTP